MASWAQHWDTDEVLEPEEPDSEEEEEPQETDRKRKKPRHALPMPEDGYPKHLWDEQFQQGHPGFNEHARQVLKKMKWASPTQGNIQLLPQQSVIASLVHPSSPVCRLLCDHNTGSGKTLCMVRIMDNFYFDARPKIAIFPKDTVVDNFYQSLWQWPSRWRDYCCFLNPTEAKLACDKEDWQQVRHEQWCLAKSQALQRRATSEGMGLQKAIKEFCVKPMRATCEMKRDFFRGQASASWLDSFWSKAGQGNSGIHPPTAPLRAYRFTSAGGRAAEVEGGVPRGCVFKAGLRRAW